MVSLQKYLDGVEQIYKEQPVYKHGHDGSDGQCDCIGMVKGALRRAGCDPNGLSGTNYAARYGHLNLKPLTSASQLQVGDVVLKAKNPGESGYDLPDAYKTGGKNYNGDLKDYYHIGTVTSVNPLVITHMTSPTAKKDTSLGKWNYYGQLPQVDYGEGGGGEMDKATVHSENGGSVKMRAKPSTSCATYWDIPNGTVVDLIEWGEPWANIAYGGHTGYMMSKFLVRGEIVPGDQDEPDGDTIMVSRKELEDIYKILEDVYNTIGDWLGLRG